MYTNNQDVYGEKIEVVSREMWQLWLPSCQGHVLFCDMRFCQSTHPHLQTICVSQFLVYLGPIFSFFGKVQDFYGRYSLNWTHLFPGWRWQLWTGRRSMTFCNKLNQSLHGGSFFSCFWGEVSGGGLHHPASSSCAGRRLHQGWKLQKGCFDPTLIPRRHIPLQKCLLIN